MGRSPSSLPTQQLAQMAAEARPSVLGGACPKETPSYHWRQGPTEGIPEGREGQKDQEVLAWHGCPPRDLGSIKRVLNSLFGSSPSHG